MADNFSRLRPGDFSPKLMDHFLMRNGSCPRWLRDLLRFLFVSPCGLVIEADGIVPDADWTVFFREIDLTNRFVDAPILS